MTTQLTQSPLDTADAVYTHTVPAGEGWMHVLKKGQTIRITDLHGNQGRGHHLFQRRPHQRALSCSQHHARAKKRLYFHRYEYPFQ